MSLKGNDTKGKENKEEQLLAASGAPGSADERLAAAVMRSLEMNFENTPVYYKLRFWLRIQNQSSISELPLTRNQFKGK